MWNRWHITSAAPGSAFYFTKLGFLLLSASYALLLSPRLFQFQCRSIYFKYQWRMWDEIFSYNTQLSHYASLCLWHSIRCQITQGLDGISRTFAPTCSFDDLFPPILFFALLVWDLPLVLQTLWPSLSVSDQSEIHHSFVASWAQLICGSRVQIHSDSATLKIELWTRTL
jgi:hypothetical protein